MCRWRCRCCRRLFCLTLSGHRSQWCLYRNCFALARTFTLWINVCVYFECYEVVFSQTTTFPVIKWSSDSERWWIGTLLLRWSHMMQVALVCLMLLPFGWPECVQIFISSLAAQWDRSSTQRYFHHIHTHGRKRRNNRKFSSSMWMAGQTFYYIEFEIICLTFGCFSYVFFLFCLFLRRWWFFVSSSASVCYTFHFVFIAVENRKIFWRHAKSTLLLISIQNNANTKTSNHILMWWFRLCVGTNGVEIRAKHTNNGWNLEFYQQYQFNTYR